MAISRSSTSVLSVIREIASLWATNLYYESLPGREKWSCINESGRKEPPKYIKDVGTKVIPDEATIAVRNGYDSKKSKLLSPRGTDEFRRTGPTHITEGWWSLKEADVLPNEAITGQARPTRLPDIMYTERQRLCQETMQIRSLLRN